MTNAQFVDKIIEQVRANNVDGSIPRRYILFTGRDIVTTLISQKLKERTLFNDMGIYTPYDCVEFKKVESIKCPLIQLRMCKTLMKSEKPLPKPIYSRLGSSIKNIRSVDGGFTFTIGQETAIRRDSRRKYKADFDIKVYIGSDNHLYIPDHEIYTLSLDLITIETEKCDCDDDCRSNWEYEFIVPDRFVAQVMDLTLQKVLTYKQIPEDNNPNNIDGN